MGLVVHQLLELTAVRKDVVDNNKGAKRYGLLDRNGLTAITAYDSVSVTGETSGPS